MQFTVVAIAGKVGKERSRPASNQTSVNGTFDNGTNTTLELPGERGEDMADAGSAATSTSAAEPPPDTGRELSSECWLG
jgi:hypothetical protein